MACIGVVYFLHVDASTKSLLYGYPHVKNTPVENVHM